MPRNTDRRSVPGRASPRFPTAPRISRRCSHLTARGFGRSFVPSGLWRYTIPAPDLGSGSKLPSIDLLELLDASKCNSVLAGLKGSRSGLHRVAIFQRRAWARKRAVYRYRYRQSVSLRIRQEWRLWYQYYFHTERGRAALTSRRNELCRLLWQLWSPTWTFDDAAYNRTATSFQNPDFVDVVIHSYRHRLGNIAGDPRYSSLESRLATLPKINIPTIVIHGTVDGVNPPEKSKEHAKYFASEYERRLLENVGHNPPQEVPELFAKAILDLCSS